MSQDNNNNERQASVSRNPTATDVQHAPQANPVDSLKSYENCPEVNVVGGKYSQSDCLACTSNCVVLPNEEFELEVDEVNNNCRFKTHSGNYISSSSLSPVSLPNEHFELEVDQANNCRFKTHSGKYISSSSLSPVFVFTPEQMTRACKQTSLHAIA